MPPVTTLVFQVFAVLFIFWSILNEQLVWKKWQASGLFQAKLSSEALSCSAVLFYIFDFSDISQDLEKRETKVG